MKQLFDLNGKAALVTGASSGMGKAIAEALGMRGASVILSSNDEQACHSVAADFQTRGIDAYAIPCDMGERLQIDSLVTSILATWKGIDILVSCVGIAPAGSFMDIIDQEQFGQTMTLNLESAIYLTRQLLPGMVARQEGSIIYLASIAAVRGNKNIGLYGISKAGLVQLARNLAVEYGPYNIRVNAISPGLIDTPFSASLLAQEEFMERRLQQTPLRRVGQPEEIAAVALLLASSGGAFITGQNIIVDGGTTISDGN